MQEFGVTSYKSEHFALVAQVIMSSTFCWQAAALIRTFVHVYTAVENPLHLQILWGYMEQSESLLHVTKLVGAVEQ